ARLAVEPEQRGIDLRVAETTVARLDQYPVVLRGMVEEGLDQRFRGRKLPGPLRDAPLQRLVEHGQRALGVLRRRHIMSDADEADMFATRIEARLRLGPQPAPLAVVTAVTRLERERLERAFACLLLLEYSLKIVRMKRLAPVEIERLVQRSAEKL